MVDPLSALLAKPLDEAIRKLTDAALARLHKKRQQQVQHGHRIEADLDAMRRGELGNTADNEWLAAKYAVRDTFDAVVPLDPQQIFLHEFSVPALLAHLRPVSNRVLQSASLEPAAAAGYQRMLERCCEEIVRALLGDGDFMAWVTSETYNSVRRIEDVAQEVRSDLGERSRIAQHRAFESRYLDDIAESISGFELFQVNVGRAPQRYPFDRFYVIPSVTRRASSTDDDADPGLTGAGTDGANAINDSPHVFLLGGAGAGKTTFLQWLAYTAARDGRRRADSPGRDMVPFYVPLRRFTDAALPQMEDLLTTTAWALAGEKPDQWVSRLFRSGRALLLVDGVDELAARRRQEVQGWLEDMVRAFPEARYVISSRPSAVDDTWLSGSRSGSRGAFVRLELLPLSANGLRDVIGCWYAAAREDESDPVQREWLTTCQRGLLESLDTRPELRTLVSSPLLCALLCALYRQGNMYLPHSRRELLEAALDLLLVRWDIHRGLSDMGLQLSKGEQLVLLQRFAASMAREEELLVSKPVAQRRLQAAMRGLRSHDADPADVLQYVLERTGLLREHPAEHKLRFVHRTFRDYLVAREMIESGELTGLVNHADEDAWHEVVFMAVAQARPRERAELLTKLLAKAGQRGIAPERADRLVLVAAACLGYAEVIDPDTVRLEVESEVRRLIPPRSDQDVDMLARAGSFVIDLMPGPDGLAVGDQDAAVRVLRTLAKIGGEQAWGKIRLFVALHDSVVNNELLSAWRGFDYSEKYAQDLLSHVDFGDWAFPVRRWEVLCQLRHLTTLRAVQLIGDVPLRDRRRDQYPLADIPELRKLELVANEVVRDLTPLARCRTLHTLKVSRIPARSRSLAGVDRCAQLQELEISAPVPDSDVALLRGHPSLRVLRVPGADPAERDRLRRELPAIDIQ